MQRAPDMKRSALLLLLVLTSLVAVAQEARNVAYGEFGGSAIAPSVNYERRFRESWFGRIGVSYIHSETVNDEGTDTDETFVLPLTASWISHPQGRHHFEAGGGVTFITGDSQDLYFDEGDEEEDVSGAYLTGIAGYRYQKPGNAFVFRATLTPIAGDGELLFWGGVSFGYAW